MRYLFLLLAIACIPLAAEEVSEPEARTEISIVRDVLQPMGMPLVSSFHKVRESMFLNVKTNSKNRLEAIGNFFLIPSRFLFGGKNVAVDEKGEIHLNPSFKYQKHLALKTGLSIIALPVSQILGALFKGLAYLSPSTRKQYKELTTAVHASIREQQNYYRTLGIPAFHSEEWAPCQNHKRAASVSAKHRLEIETLKKITDILDQHKIIYWIDCGTCLGAYRYGGFIPWDWDIDISILTPDHDNVKNALSTLDNKEYQIQDWSSYAYPKTFLKLYIKKTKTLIDIYHYNIDPTAQTLTYFFTFKDTPLPMEWKKEELSLMKPLPYDQIFPLKKAHFDGLTVWVPHKIEEYLKGKYGDNLDPTMVWDEEANIYQKVADHPYWKDH